MKQITVLEYIENNKEFLFPNRKYSEMEMENILMQADDSLEYIIQNAALMNPKTALLIDIFGFGGLNRMIMAFTSKNSFNWKEFILGFIKTVIPFAFIIWTIYDIITSRKRCCTYNCQRLIDLISNPYNVKTKQQAEIDKQNGKVIGKAVLEGAIGIRNSVKEFNDSLGGPYC